MHFASENFDATHPEMIKALLKANQGFAPSYGKDAITLQAVDDIKKAFGKKDIGVFFCFNGTGANNFAIASIAPKHSAILCADISHLYTAESTAPETFTGCRLYPVQTLHGKIIIEELQKKIRVQNDMHRPPVSVLTITQPTEYGTIYTHAELKTIAKLCRENKILLHIDGARLFNALAATNDSLADLIKISKADVITLGGTKAGLMFGEAVIFFNSKRFRHLQYNHKRSMQLASKNRFIAAQFSALLKNELWKKIATHTNALAKYFEAGLIKAGCNALVHPVQTNVVFLKMEKVVFEKLRETVNFYRWDEEKDEVRFVFSFSNTRTEAKDLIKNIVDLNLADEAKI